MEDQKQKGKDLLGLIEQIRQKRREQDALFAELQEVAELMVQGIDPREIAHVSFLATDLTEVNHKLQREVETDELYCPTGPKRIWITRATMKDGTVVVLNPPLKRHRRKRIV